MPRLSKIGAACLAAFGWTSGAAAVSASYLVVAGGGGGGGAAGTASGGGGGAGGLLTGTTTLNTTLSYTVVVGAGASSAGIQGSNSVFNAITSTGGGLGGRGIQNGGNGGSGGGSCGQASGAGLGTAGQGNNGGVGSGFGYTGGGGGGGAGAAGGNADGSSLGGPGGNGSASSISGTSVTYAGGGGGGTNFSTTQQAGGTGGGGIGGSTSSVVGGNGTANLGAGGGGGGSTSSAVGGNGGSGVVIISYPSPQKFGGGIVTESGGNTIHTFQTSGTLSPLSSLTASYLIVAGGAGTCGRGGAGAGGLLSGSSLTIDTNSIYLVTVGAGGTGTAGGSTASAVGGNSAFSMVTTTAVGGGSGGTTANTNGASGGSGGGGTVGTGTGGAGTAGQGNAGGNGGAFSGNFTSGGGGGAGAAGQAGQVGAGGAGGVGVSSSISGTATFYAGGGGGHADTSASGVGGNGGGGAGALGDANGTNGTANTGGGAGGSNPTTKFAQGGSGVVIISYPGSTQLMAGGTVTVAGGNVIHTFTSSGYLTPLTLVGNSLRFRQSATAYMGRTPSVAGNQQTWTFSAWIKRGSTTLEGTLVSGGTSTRLAVFFDSSGRLISDISGVGTYDQSTAVYRDPAAWYHFVWQFDTTQAIAANRSRMYMNGVAVALTNTRTFAQNTNYYINNTELQTIGVLSNNTAAYNFDGYMTECNFIDGQALTPNSFGTFNSFGVWQPIVYGGSYGTNGFYLPFTNTGTISASYLVVAGGGGGGSDASNGTQAGGGGAGGYLTSTVTLPINGAFTVTVGGGGTGGTGSNSGSDGSDSVLSGAGISTITSTGGGRGGSRNTNSANSGGSGGGGAPSSIGTGTVGQGNDGGTGNTTGGGGGGGAGAVGGSTTAPDGGIGLQSSISGTATYYAGGGGGRSGSSPFTQGTGGLGGGGAYGNAGTTNTGGGGGGGGGAGGKDGGSGIVIISYAGSQRFTGGTITSSGGNTIHTFTASGTLGVGIAADYSPQGNNWTPNNISLTLGSTYDSMTDVPTLTSTTAANYCVLNPLSSGSFNTISNANLKVAGNTSTNNGNTRSTIYFTTGKWYIEMTAGATSASVYPSSGIIPASNAGSPDNGGTNQVGYPANSVSYEISGNKRIANSTSSYGSTYTTGDVIGIAIDADNGAIYFSKNGTFQNSGVPTSGGSKTGAAFTWTGGSIEYAFATAQYDGSDGSFNFGQQPFTYTPPSGFLPLNTFNL